jgi:hypothetical protein
MLMPQGAQQTYDVGHMTAAIAMMNVGVQNFHE